VSSGGELRAYIEHRKRPGDEVTLDVLTNERERRPAAHDSRRLEDMWTDPPVAPELFVFSRLDSTGVMSAKEPLRSSRAPRPPAVRRTRHAQEALMIA
jgi:hypothetical protein